MKKIIFMMFILGVVLSSIAFADGQLNPKITKEQAIDIAKKYLIEKYQYPKDFSNENISVSTEESQHLRLTNPNTTNDQWVIKVVPNKGFGGCIVYVDDQTGDVDGWLGIE